MQPVQRIFPPTHLWIHTRETKMPGAQMRPGANRQFQFRE
jgi:hypothetical protein